MSWYELDHMAWERTRELEAAAVRPQPKSEASPERSSAAERPQPLRVVAGELGHDLTGVLAEPRRRASNGQRTVVELPRRTCDGDASRARVL